jgi:hypothetical protein
LQLFGANDELVEKALWRGLRQGDTVLSQSAYFEALERGLPAADEYRAKHADADEAWKTYSRDRRAAESREHILAGAILKKAAL